MEPAGGTIGGDGAGVVVLKRLDAALADRDTIHAILLASVSTTTAPTRCRRSADSA
jgi:acyl transferase domain-containing protein